MKLTKILRSMLVGLVVLSVIGVGCLAQAEKKPVVLSYYAAVELGQGMMIVAHRGSAAYLPEHTLESYAYAFAQGVDVEYPSMFYIEPDLVLTKDNVFICVHDTSLEKTTDIEEVFPDRHREDGKWYAIDFTLEEIKQLRVHERCRDDGTPYFENRFPLGASSFELPTFNEFIELMQGLNRSTGARIGIFPELKQPAWHIEEGHPMEELFLATLDTYGYNEPDAAPIMIQSFDVTCLKRLRELGTDLCLIQCMSTRHTDMITQEGLAEIATYADGVGPYKVVIENNPAFVEWAHAEGLPVIAYTMREESLSARYATAEQEMHYYYFTLMVDGLWVDQPDIAIRVLQGVNK